MRAQAVSVLAMPHSVGPLKPPHFGRTLTLNEIAAHELGHSLIAQIIGNEVRAMRMADPQIVGIDAIDVKGLNTTTVEEKPLQTISDTYAYICRKAAGGVLQFKLYPLNDRKLRRKCIWQDLQDIYSVLRILKDHLMHKPVKGYKFKPEIITKEPDALWRAFIGDQVHQTLGNVFDGIGTDKLRQIVIDLVDLHKKTTNPLNSPEMVRAFFAQYFPPGSLDPYKKQIFADSRKCFAAVP